MITLKSFEVILYPDGHNHIKSTLDLHNEETLTVAIKSFDDLFLVAQIKQIHPELKYLNIVYLLAARCDRRFSPGEAVDLKIVLEFIASLKFEHVSILHPHNADFVANYGVRNYYVDKELLKALETRIGIKFEFSNSCFIGADKGISSYLNRHYNSKYHNAFCFSKTRNKNGGIEIIGELEDHNDFANYVIVDDLCDGGGTFKAVAEKIKATNPTSKIYLMVTHAIFSKGFDFAKDIDLIVCSNSFSNVTHEKVIQVPVI